MGRFFRAIRDGFREIRAKKQKARERRVLIAEAVLALLKDRQYEWMDIQDIRDALSSKSISTSISDIEEALRSIMIRRDVTVCLDKRYRYEG